MKKLILSISIILIMINIIKAQDNEEIKLAHQAFTELKMLLNEDHSNLWNYNLYGPILLVNRKTRELIANEPDVEGFLSKREELYIGKLPENINIANTAINWKGKRWTVVLMPLPEQKDERLNLLIHESFHRIQPSIGFDSLYEITCSHLDTKIGRIYMKLEFLALKEALKSDDYKKHLNNALLFRKYRYQLINDAKEAENSMEINEGLAEYTGSILSGRTENELKEHYISYIDRFLNLPTYVRSFSYFAIPVYGFYMQLEEPYWNHEINQRTNLTDYMIDFYDFKGEKIDEEKVKQIGLIYDIDSVTAFEEEREQNQIKVVSQYKSRFSGNDIVLLNLEKMRFSFNPSNLVPLDTLGTVYPNMRVTDNWGILEVNKNGALMHKNWKTITLSSPLDISSDLIKGDGWELKLNEGWSLKKIDNYYTVERESKD